MATVATALIPPQPDSIKQHLAALFGPAREHYPQGLLELRFGQNGTLDRYAYFGIHDAGIDAAAEYAAHRNHEGCNVYVGVNPRKPATDRKRAASASDVEMAIWHFADLDSAEAVNAAGKRLKPLAPNMTVTTGTVPHRRVHLYWQLDEPIGNLDAWTERQRGIAQTLEGDSVIDPPRIMRLAGTVNYPTRDKMDGRGHRPELVTLKGFDDADRSPVTPEDVSGAFPVQSIAVAPNVEGQTTLQAMARTHVADLLTACRSGDHWHNHMVRLVAHMASTGRTTAEILALADHITLPGYTVDQTAREMAKALQGARTKWDIPEPEDDIETEEAAREEADAIFDLLDIGQLEAMPPPTWLIHELVAEDGLTVIYGDPGAGKSFIAIDAALRLAHDMDWHGTEAKATGVLYIAGEGVRGLGNRIKGWKREHAMEGVDVPFLLLPIAVQLLDAKQRAKLLRTITAAMERAGFQIGLIVIDTVSRALAGADENTQESMSAFVGACDEIRRHAGGALIAVHHSGKDKDRGMRGSTVLLGGCDASIRVSKADRTVTLKTEKQKDAEEAPPIYMEMKRVEWAAGLQEPQSTLVPLKLALKDEASSISSDLIARAFGMMTDAWATGHPLSHRVETRRDGRYAPRIFQSRLGGSAELWADHLQAWLENGCVAYEVVNKSTKAKGLQVIECPV